MKKRRFKKKHFDRFEGNRKKHDDSIRKLVDKLLTIRQWISQSLNSKVTNFKIVHGIRRKLKSLASKQIN